MTADRKDVPPAVDAAQAAPQVRRSTYPDPFAARMMKREKRPLGDLFGLTKFGVNLTRIAPGGESSLFHRHHGQDEFIYILEGRPTLITDRGETPLAPGMCAGFAAGGTAHHLANRTASDIVYLEVGDRGPDDPVDYPDDDLQALPTAGGGRRFTRKDGTPY